MNAIVLDILQGKHDGDLDAIQAAVTERRKLVRKTVGAVTLREIGVGQKVRLLAIRPKYMIGKIGIVVDKTASKFVVDFIDETGRFGRGRVTVPASCVEPA